MRAFIASLLVLFVSASPAAAQIFCDVTNPNVCAEIEGAPVFDTKALATFNVQFNQPITSLVVELMWETEDKEYAVITVPQKITQISERLFEVKGVLTMIEGKWVVELKPAIGAESAEIIVPIEVK